LPDSQLPGAGVVPPEGYIPGEELGPGGMQGTFGTPPGSLPGRMNLPDRGQVTGGVSGITGGRLNLPDRGITSGGVTGGRLNLPDRGQVSPAGKSNSFGDAIMGILNAMPQAGAPFRTTGKQSPLQQVLPKGNQQPASGGAQQTIPQTPGNANRPQNGLESWEGSRLNELGNSLFDAVAGTGIKPPYVSASDLFMIRNLYAPTMTPKEFEDMMRGMEYTFDITSGQWIQPDSLLTPLMDVAGGTGGQAGGFSYQMPNLGGSYLTEYLQYMLGGGGGSATGVGGGRNTGWYSNVGGTVWNTGR
jgi:hypothetical protein